MVRRKGGLSTTGMDWEWPHQVVIEPEERGQRSCGVAIPFRYSAKAGWGFAQVNH